MRLLDRYILREILGYFLLGLGVFVFVLMMPELLRVSELLARESLSPLQKHRFRERDCRTSVAQPEDP